jgi:serine/threonine protein kinase
MASASPDGRDVQPFALGEVVAQRYHVESLLCEDDLGWVYEVTETGPAASQDGPRPQLALRLIRPRFFADDFVLTSEARKQWRSQLSMLRDLRHANIVPVHEVCLGDEQGRVYTVRAAVELEGQKLGDVLQSRSGGLPEPEAVRLCAAIAEAVEAAHQRGVQHLALSPQRVFVVPSGEAVHIKVADFALIPPSLSPQYCAPGYLSPEQIEGQPCDRRTDQFSLAVLFYEMLSGQPAFIGAPDEDRQTILRRVISEDPLPLALSRPIELALARALSRSRAVRFPGLSDFICALGVDGVAWTVVRPPGPARSQFSPPPRPRTRLFLPVLLGALAASCGLGAYFFLMARDLHLGFRPTVPPDLLRPAGPDLGLASQKAPPRPPSAPPTPPTHIDLRPTFPPLRLASELPAPLPPSTGTANVNRPPGVPSVGNVGKPGSTGTPSGASSGTSSDSFPQIPLPPVGEADVQITTDGPPLSARHLDRIRYCIRLVRPRPPFQAVLEPFRGTLLVSPRTQSLELRESTDFRNCLKNEVQGNIEAKDVYVKGIPKVKGAP